VTASKKMNVVGWVLSGLVAAFLGVSALGKLGLLPNPEMQESLATLGWTLEGIYPIGFVEIAAFVLFLIPRTAFLGAILLTAYLGGAVATHARIGDPQLVGGIIIGVVTWVAFALRRPDVIKSAFCASSCETRCATK